MREFRQRWRNIREARKAVAARLKTRYSLRLHSFLLFAWTMSASVLTAYLCRKLGMSSLPERYAFASALGYAAFLLGVRLWLSWVEAMPHGAARRAGTTSGADDAGDYIDVVEIGADSAEMLGGAIEGTAEAASAISEGGIAALGLAAVVLVVILAALFLGPEMLIDVAFEAILAGSLIGALRLGREPDWFLHVLGKTWWVFLLAAALMVAFGKYAQLRYPDADTTAAVLHQMFGHAN